jgi:alkylation response protein AidB-like acyl-CoA dehydrogenase
MLLHRPMSSPEALDIVELVRDVAHKELAPHAADAEREERFPRETFRTIGELGLLGLPYAEEFGGGEQPSEVYLQVIEELGAAWATIGLGVSVHTLACLPIAKYGTDEQRERWLPDMLGGELLGAYCLSEAHAGSDPAAMITRATRRGDEYVIRGAKAWTSHGGQADFYTVLARTSDEGGKGISCFHVPANTPGLTSSPPENKMGLTGSHTTTMHFDDVVIPADHRIGDEGKGLSIALDALDSGRLGIAALATGVAQAALTLAIDYAKHRETFGKPIIEHQGLGFMLADMTARVVSGRATYLAAARLRDSGQPFSMDASIAKLVCTDNAMQVALDAVQVLGGAGYTRDFAAERYMREVKAMQIFEGTNQIQRLVIARALSRS